MSGVPWYCREYARTAWRFLDTTGYINFGVSPELLERQEIHGKPKGTVIVVGAGLAGVARTAARAISACFHLASGNQRNVSYTGVTVGREVCDAVQGLRLRSTFGS